MNRENEGKKSIDEDIVDVEVWPSEMASCQQSLSLPTGALDQEGVVDYVDVPLSSKRQLPQRIQPTAEGGLAIGNFQFVCLRSGDVSEMFCSRDLMCIQQPWVTAEAMINLGFIVSLEVVESNPQERFCRQMKDYLAREGKKPWLAQISWNDIPQPHQQMIQFLMGSGFELLSIRGSAHIEICLLCKDKSGEKAFISLTWISDVENAPPGPRQHLTNCVRKAKVLGFKPERLPRWYRD